MYASAERHDGNAAATVLINSNKSLLFDELQAVEDEDDDIPMNIGTTRLLLRKQTILERFAYYHSNRFQSALSAEHRNAPKDKHKHVRNIMASTELRSGQLI